MARQIREDPNGEFAPRATTKTLNPNKCVAARLGAVGNEAQCGRDRVDGEWCQEHGPTLRAARKKETEVSKEDHLRTLVEQWAEEQDKQHEARNRLKQLSERVESAFKPVFDELCLSKLPWELRVTHGDLGGGSVSLEAEADGKALGLHLLEYNDYRLHEWMLLRVDGIRVGYAEFMNQIFLEFESMDAAVAFCKERGITPKIEGLKAQRMKVQKEVDQLDLAIAELTKS